MISRLLKEIIKIGVTGIFIAYLTYVHADRIENAVNTIKYTFIESETTFVKKEQALDMKIKYERNGRNNLETYVKTYNQKFPVYERQNGLMIGESSYLFSNLTEEERNELCFNIPQKPKKNNVKKADKVKKFLYEIYKNMEDEKDE